MTRIDHHHHIHFHPDPDPRLDTIVEQLKAIRRQIGTQMSAIDDLTAAVANDTTVDQSAISLLEGLKAALDQAIASNDPAALQALSDQLGANQAALSAAVTANTPAAPDAAPVDEPPVEPTA